MGDKTVDMTTGQQIVVRRSRFNGGKNVVVEVWNPGGARSWATELSEEEALALAGALRGAVRPEDG